MVWDRDWTGQRDTVCFGSLGLVGLVFYINILCSSPRAAAFQLTSNIWACSLVDQTTDRNESKKGYGHELLYLLANKKAPHKKIIKSPHRVVTKRAQWRRRVWCRRPGEKNTELSTAHSIWKEIYGSLDGLLFLCAPQTPKHPHISLK